jgi:hypothetical protein
MSERDPAFGPGHTFALADGLSRLTLFPHAVRLTTPDLRLEVFRASAPIISGEGVVFDHPEPPATSLFALSPTEAMLHVVFASRPDISHQGTKCDENTVDPSERPDASSVPLRPRRRDHMPSEGHPRDALPSPTEQDERVKDERVKIAGRVGKDPLFRLIRARKLVGQFPLAVPVDADTVRWEMVVAHGARAEKLRDELKLTRGRFVEVVGYRHRQRRTDRQGREKIVEEIYVTAIVPR